MSTVAPTVRPAGNAGEGIIIAAGMIVAAAGWKRNHHLGEWWWKSLVGIVGLCIVASAMSRTHFAPIVKAIAWLMFITACIYAAPIFRTPTVKPDVKIDPDSRKSTVHGGGHPS